MDAFGQIWLLRHAVHLLAVLGVVGVGWRGRGLDRWVALVAGAALVALWMPEVLWLGGHGVLRRTRGPQDLASLLPLPAVAMGVVGGIGALLLSGSGALHKGAPGSVWARLAVACLLGTLALHHWPAHAEWLGSWMAASMEGIRIAADNLKALPLVGVVGSAMLWVRATGESAAGGPGG